MNRAACPHMLFIRAYAVKLLQFLILENLLALGNTRFG